MTILKSTIDKRRGGGYYKDRLTENNNKNVLKQPSDGFIEFMDSIPFEMIKAYNLIIINGVLTVNVYFAKEGNG